MENQKNQKVSSRRSNSAGSLPTVQFLSAVITEADKRIIKENYVDPEAINYFLTLAIESGYRVGIKWREYQGAVQASLSADSTEHINYGLVLCQYHRDPFRALAVLAWAAATKYHLTESWAPTQLSFDGDW